MHTTSSKSSTLRNTVLRRRSQTWNREREREREITNLPPSFSWYLNPPVLPLMTTSNVMVSLEFCFKSIKKNKVEKAIQPKKRKNEMTKPLFSTYSHFHAWTHVLNRKLNSHRRCRRSHLLNRARTFTQSAQLAHIHSTQFRNPLCGLV